LRARGRELGMNDTQVAHRLGMTQRRYSSYVNETREPNFFDLLRICAVLATTPDYVLGVRPMDPSEDQEWRVVSALRAMPEQARLLALAALEAMAGVAPTQPSDPSRRKARTVASPPRRRA